MSANSADPTDRSDVAREVVVEVALEVVLVKAGRTKIRYPAELLHDDGTRVTVRAPWAGEGVRDFGFVRFEPGDVFVEHYWRDRWYAVKEVRDGAGTLKGWYCDITRPAGVSATPSGTELVVEDLDLDLWRSADGSAVLRLDEDEFAASGLARTDPGAASAAVAALDELETLAREGGFGALLG
ncbi:DUF402 domain-containing protein [Streptomyces sp. KM273126]|uniref:DUF402 domain-containing protein n=1 Tax=Streptomyces sp. KM273126 TaxID=2545247 RepID=UPI00103C0C79|nr:DUF402 domain-containing protein [Streptomyces sp. KM273126]MBA2812314.1 DUF402 domain-containing protein [Streptomyces sp. KM273126]